MKSNQTVINILLISATLAGFHLLLSAFFDDIHFELNLGIALFLYGTSRFLIKLGWIDEPEHLEKEYVEDPLTKLRFTDSTLVIGNYEIEKSKIKRVVLDNVKDYDSKHYQGLVQLPFNQQKGAIPELWFDPLHLQSLKNHIQIHIPNVTFIK